MQVAIDNGVAAGGHGQRRFCDSGAQIAWNRHAVVAGVGAAQSIAGHADRLATGRILVGKTGPCRAHRDAVATDHAGDGCVRNRCHRGAVIDLVACADAAQAQSLRRDVGAQIGRRTQGIVALVGAIQRRPIKRDGLAAAGVPVGKTGIAQRERHHVRGQHTGECATAQGGSCSLVIDLVVGRQAADRQRCRCHCECCRRQRIVGARCTTERQRPQADVLAHAHVLARQAAVAAIHRDHVLPDQPRE